MANGALLEVVTEIGRAAAFRTGNAKDIHAANARVVIAVEQLIHIKLNLQFWHDRVGGHESERRVAGSAHTCRGVDIAYGIDAAAQRKLIRQDIGRP